MFFLIAIIIWLFVKWSSERSSRIEAEQLNTIAFEQAKQSLEKQKVDYLNSFYKHQENAMIKLEAVKMVECDLKKILERRKKYEQEIKRITTYTSRQRYADSLASTMR